MDHSFRQEVERARQLTGAQKMQESLQLFERTSTLMLAGLREEFPNLDNEALLQKLYERLAINRDLETARVSNDP